MKIKMGTVQSAAISKIGFSGAAGQSGNLKVEFTGGTTKTYKDVPYVVYRKFVLAKSCERFCNDHIKGKF